MKWWFIGDAESGWKSHFFPDALKDKLLRSLKGRGMQFQPDGHPLALKEVTEVGVDGGGSCFVDESIMEYQLEGAKFTIPATQVEAYLGIIIGLPERLELGTPYYKVHGRWHCVCLRPEDRQELIAQIEARLGEAVALRRAENQKWNRFVDGVKEDGVALRVAKKVADTDVEA